MTRANILLQENNFLTPLHEILVSKKFTDSKAEEGEWNIWGYGIALVEVDPDSGKRCTTVAWSVMGGFFCRTAVFDCFWIGRVPAERGLEERAANEQVFLDTWPGCVFVS